MHRYLLFVCLAGVVACKPSLPTNPGDVSPTPTDPPPTQTETPVPQIKYKQVRGIVHVHSAYSHDACDDQGIVGGVVNQPCIDDLRQSACDAGLDFVALTDHPSFMRDYSMQEVLLHDAAAGDQLIQGADGPDANISECADGSTVTWLAGYEGSPHLMPLGIRKSLPPELYEGMENSMPIVDVQTVVSGLQSHGAFVSMAHSEEDNISAQHILDSGIDGMEWYNPHGNFESFLSADLLGGSDLEELIDRLGSIQSFLLGADDPAHADLVYLILLQSFPMAGLDKWREVQVSRPVIGMFGSDVHQNVSVDPLCTPELMPLCELAAIAFPHVLTSLIAGGTIDLSDGDRIDSYARVLRWLENRVLVEEETIAEFRDSLVAGRVFGVFTVFGDPSGFSVETIDRDGRNWPVGSVVEAADRIEITNPVPAALSGVQFSADQAVTAEVTTRLLRLEASGPVLVAESNDLGQQWTHTVTEPGGYYVEVWIKPFHFTDALGPEPQLADAQYLWVITNPMWL